jgi:hypothetical protein
MVQAQSKLETRQDHVASVLQQLNQDYQSAKSERSSLAKVYPGNDDEFALIEELELLTVDICGYASQIKDSGTVRNVDSAIVQLQSLNVLENAAIVQFYGDVPAEYPQIQAYIRLLDYLRLLTLEYLQNRSKLVPQCS